MTDKNTPDSGQEATNVQIELQRFYLKEQSCRVPYGFQGFEQSGKLEYRHEMNLQHQVIGDNRFEVVLNFSLTASYEKITAYTVSVQQAGIMHTTTKDPNALTHLLNIYMPTMLFPYVRKHIGDAIFNAGFESVLLPPVDFSQMLQQQQAESAQSTEGKQESVQAGSHADKWQDFNKQVKKSAFKGNKSDREVQ